MSSVVQSIQFFCQNQEGNDSYSGRLHFTKIWEHLLATFLSAFSPSKPVAATNFSFKAPNVKGEFLKPSDTPLSV
jgi:hypothetical protein